MKLRNKKTGGIWDIPKMRHPTMQEDDISFFAYGKDEGCLFSYHSLAELNKEWEDYEPTEPLIKDEKIRKAVRAWAEANNIRFGKRCSSINKYSKRIVGWNAVGVAFTIEFDKDLKIYGDSITKDYYTIAELCGEEDE